MASCDDQALEKRVLQREKDVGIVEREIEANTIGDGTYVVGSDIKTGLDTVTTEGPWNSDLLTLLCSS